MHEIRVNIHMHSVYSDGNKTHDQIAIDAIEAGLDAIIITDHNVFVNGIAGYFHNGGKKTLLLIGEEIHDQDRIPQKNHLLAVGADCELSTLADDPHELVDRINFVGGLSFIAHPVDPELNLFNETDISWEAWDITGITGIELWNGLSEIKTVVKTKLDAIKYAFFPQLLAHNPLPQTLKLWDQLLAKGSKVVAIGGSDAHSSTFRMGLLRKTIFPYYFHFTAINTHLLISKEFSGDFEHDSLLIYQALAKGHAFIGYDLPGSTDGFLFSARNSSISTIMGDEIILDEKTNLLIHIPEDGEIRIIKDGELFSSSKSKDLEQHIYKTGVYRVEVYRNFLGKRRGWIFSNPIYVK